MSDKISSKVVREIISDILIERSNFIMQTCDEIMEKEMLDCGATGDYSGEIGTTSCGTRVLADEILYGQIPIEEAIWEILSSEERKEAKSRCKKWIEERNEIEK